MKTRIVYVNGAWVPENEASISIFDRGFLMSDAVYEVSAVVDGKMVDNVAHLQRLQRSLDALNIPLPLSLAEIITLQKRLIAENQLTEGVIYLHVTRGSADRDFLFDTTMQPSLVMFTQKKSIVDVPAAKQGLRVMSHPDIRWQRRDIKTTQLLAQSLAKMAAHAAGYDDAWMVDGDGMVTEGSSNNVWIIKDKVLITRPATHDILNGITRQALISVLEDTGVSLQERPFSIAEARVADEALMSAAGSLVLPVVEIDGQRLGDGTPGVFTRKLRERYLEHMRTAED
ncbi:MAG: D-amino-acid transaminase [Cardiobacteriaceae bacterium]|nr:D-amino-acid transaminase [Cardiobacteriaceae bacterium]